MPIVLIPTPLRRFTKNSSKVLVSGTVVSEVVDNLVLDYPEVQNHLLDSSGSIRQFINIFVDEDDIRNLRQLDTIVNVFGDKVEFCEGCIHCMEEIDK